MARLQMMGGLLVGLLAAGVATAQTRPQPTEHDYVCMVAPEACNDSAGDATTAPARGDTRGMGVAGYEAPRAAVATPRRQVASSVGSTAPRRAAPARHVVGVSNNDLMITFANGSAELTPGAQANASRFAKVLSMPQLAGVRVMIEGHTNAVGTAEANRELSDRRAQALVDFLANAGVDRSRLEARGYGFDRPLPNLSATAPENRRVEVTRLR